MSDLLRHRAQLYLTQLGFEPFIAPIDFNLDAQELNLPLIYTQESSSNKKAIYYIDPLATSTSLAALSNWYYKWAEEIAGISIETQITSGTIAWTTGSVKRYVKVFSTLSIALSLSIPATVLWIFCGKSVYQVMHYPNNTLKYIHFEKISSITGFANFGFNGCNKLEGNLTFSDTIATITGAASFGGCTGLINQLYIPDSITIIPNSAFSNCSAFTSLYISKNCTTIGSQSFQNMTAARGDLTIPLSVNSIGAYCFYQGLFNGALTILNKDINITATNVFSGCTAFTALNLPVGYTGASTGGKTFNFSNNFSAASLNQSILNLIDNFGTLTIGTTNKNRLTAAYPNAVTNAAARGITIS